MLLARFSPVLATSLLVCLSVAADQAVYTDSLQNGWGNWSYATVNLNNSAPVHSGGSSISVLSTTNWQALYLHHTALDSSLYDSISFWIHGGTTGGQSVQVQAIRNGIAQSAVVLSLLPANAWRQEMVPLKSLGLTNVTDFDGFWLQARSSSTTPVFYVDDISLISATNPPSTNTSVIIAVNAQQNRKPISPLIYGVAFASSNQLKELNAPLNRSGGNSMTRYNWQLNAANRANDWYFQSIGESSGSNPGAEGDRFVTESRNGGADAMLTIPMIGWMTKLGPARGKLASYSIAKYGPQTGSDAQWMPDAGNGLSTTGSPPEITWNDPNDANFLTNSTFQEAWVRHLTNRWGVATNKGVRYFLMDNEHTLWHSTHRDVHPVGTTMQEIRDKFFDYAGKVKSVDPSALVCAPEEWGWNGYLYSGYDQQWSGKNQNWNPANFPDRGTNGGMDYMPWFLDQARQRANTTGNRLLDVFTLHIYPQGGEFNDSTTAEMQLLRNRSTRQLWDTNYVDPTWINAVIKLIPRMKAWVNTYYPGTPIGITEYNWGAEGHINGATAQADIYGIFGREGLDLATRWTTPTTGSPAFNAMKMFRNYDGANSGFGNVSVAASVPNPDQVSSFAAERSTDGALTVMVINKQLSNPATAQIQLNGFVPQGVAQVWQLTSANAITRLPDASFPGTLLTNTIPPQSITLFVLPGGNPPTLTAQALTPTNTFALRLSGTAGQRYEIQSSPNLTAWASVRTNFLTGTATNITVPASGSKLFYRAKWIP